MGMDFERGALDLDGLLDNGEVGTECDVGA